MGCFGFLKATMFAFNGLIFLAGAALLATGIWVKVDSGSVLGFLQKIENAPEELSQLLNVGYLLIAVGAFLLIIGFLGCCGAAKESKCLLLLFFVVVLILFIAEVAGAIVILVFRPLVENVVDKLGTEAVKSIRQDYGSNPDVTGLWDTTMDTLNCCGFYNYSDFDGSPFNQANASYPSQCCPLQDKPCNATVAGSGLANNTITGCFPRFKQLIEDNTVVIVAVALGIALLEVCALVVAMTLYCKIGSKSA